MSIGSHLTFQFQRRKKADSVFSGKET